MTSASLPSDPYLALRRDFTLTVDAGGRVVARDAAAAARFGIAVGDDFARLATSGSEEKVARLLATAASRGVTRWEVQLHALDGQVTVTFNGSPAQGGGVHLAGSLVSDDDATIAASLADAMAELIELQRQSAKQRRLLQSQHADLEQSTRALRESNAGVAALHAELEASNARLRETAEGKSRFFAHANHELKTPINSILALSEILLSGADGALSDEQAKQLGFIRQNAQSLNLLVEDVLGLARSDANAVMLHTARFGAAGMLAALRGMLRPLATRPGVALIVDEPPEGLELDTDEGRLAQVLRNLVSNALKFTESGEVRLRTEVDASRVTFVVSDTGIGIAPADRERIFQEFEQVRGPLQVGARGSGLGLTLSRQLVTLLAGSLTVESAVGQGSTFRVTLPLVHPESAAIEDLVTRAALPEPGRMQVLIVEDDAQTLLLYEHQLRDSGYQVIPARTLDAARALLQRVKPSAIVLDVMIETQASWSFLEEVKQDPRTSDVPVLVVTVMTREDRARALGADEFAVKPVQRDWLLRRLAALTVAAGTAPRLLIIDDDETYRYVVRRMLDGEPIDVTEATDGPEGIEAALALRPDLILLDVVMPKMSAFEVLDELKGDPRTRSIPVIVNTSKTLTAEETARLRQGAVSIVSKLSISREIALGRIREALARTERHG